MTHEPADKPDSDNHIIIVDDDTLYRRILVRALHQLDNRLTFREFVDGRAFIDWLSSAHEPIDLVILDIDMPRMNGLEAARKVKQFMPELLRKTVMISSLANPGRSAIAADIGVLAFHEKPMSFEELVLLLGTLMGGSR